MPRIWKVLLPACAIALAIASAAQMPERDHRALAGASQPDFPSPRNLKVLPKTLDGKQVQNIMKQWESELGVRCDGCHKEDDVKVNREGKPLLIFEDDSKPMKDIARLMYTMTDEINTKYVAGLGGSGVPVTCGTCHRGRIGPEPFTSGHPDERQVSSTTPPSK